MLNKSFYILINSVLCYQKIHCHKIPATATARIISRGAPAGPVEEGLVFRPEDYVYSSARDYNGERGLLDHVIVVDLYWPRERIRAAAEESSKAASDIKPDTTTTPIKGYFK